MAPSHQAEGELRLRADFPRDISSLSERACVELENKVKVYRDQLVEHHQELTTCKVCLEAPKQVVLLPCKHRALCSGCATRIDSCPICRAKVEDKIECVDH